MSPGSNPRSAPHEARRMRRRRVFAALAAALAVPGLLAPGLGFAQRIASAPGPGTIELDPKVMQTLAGCHRQPRPQELRCAQTALADHIAELEPLLPQLEARIAAHRVAMQNQQAEARRAESELADLQRAGQSPQLTPAGRQALSQRAAEKRVHLLGFRFNASQEQGSIDDKEQVLRNARRLLANARGVLAQIRAELAAGR